MALCNIDTGERIIIEAFTQLGMLNKSFRERIMSKLLSPLAFLSFCFIISCGVSSKSEGGVYAYVADNGVIGKGIASAQNERTANSIAIRLARDAIVTYLNDALARVDESIGLPSGTHGEEILSMTRVVNLNNITKKGSITTTALVEWPFDEVASWVLLYYDSLPEEDLIRQRMTKELFAERLLKQIQLTH